MRLLTETGHQIEHGIDDTPGQIATERGQEHIADTSPTPLTHAERTRHRQNHNEPEQNLGDSLHWFEETLSRFGLSFLENRQPLRLFKA
jgi:hypothetical protein